MNTISSSSPPDISSLSLSQHRSQNPHESYDYDQGPVQRSQYNYQSSPPPMSVQSPYPNGVPSNLAHTPLRVSKPARAGLPTQWLDNQGASLAEGRSLSPYQMSDLSSGGGSPPPMMNGLASQAFQTPAQANPGEDDIIPNAIVIKNIPFNVKRETLLDIITSLNIPTPYAFNYHLDQAGAFRGLAFANFRAPEDADAVVAALNGFDVQGRKLRVEYKKVLQAGEKERIEREKALRRMRSMQLEKERQTIQQFDDLNVQGGNLYSGSQLQSNAFSGSLYQQQTSPPPVQAASAYLSPTSAASKVSSANELDMNDPATLEIYSRILLFKDDPMRDELAFSRALTPKQRRIVHLIAQKLGVYHYSVGENEDRYAVVTRIDPETNQRTVPQRHASQTLSRATSSYLHSSIQASEASAGLRSKKSMPDMKTLHTTTPRLGIRASNSNLREGYATIASPSRRQNGGFGSLFGASGGGVFGGGDPSGIPPVPSLPSNLSFNSSLNEQPSSGIVRQPRGPGEGGFTLRRTSGLPVQAESNNSGSLLDARSQTDLEI